MASELEKEIENSSGKSEKKVSAIRKHHILRDVDYLCQNYHGNSLFYRKMIRNNFYRNRK